MARDDIIDRGEGWVGIGFSFDGIDAERTRQVVNAGWPNHFDEAREAARLMDEPLPDEISERFEAERERTKWAVDAAAQMAGHTAIGPVAPAGWTDILAWDLHIDGLEDVADGVTEEVVHIPPEIGDSPMDYVRRLLAVVDPNSAAAILAGSLISPKPRVYPPQAVLASVRNTKANMVAELLAATAKPRDSNRTNSQETGMDEASFIRAWRAFDVSHDFTLPTDTSEKLETSE